MESLKYFKTWQNMSLKSVTNAKNQPFNFFQKILFNKFEIFIF